MCRSLKPLILLLVLSPLAWAQEDEFDFDVEKFEPKIFEFSGYIEGQPEYANQTPIRSKHR